MRSESDLHRMSRNSSGTKRLQSAPIFLTALIILVHRPHSSRALAEEQQCIVPGCVPTLLQVTGNRPGENISGTVLPGGW